MNPTSIYLLTRLAQAGVVVAGLVLALYFGIVVAGEQGNPLSSVMRSAGICFFLTSIISPNAGLYIMIPLCAYLDLAKRLLVIYGNIHFGDVVFVLQVAPVSLAGVFLGCVLRRAMRQQLLGKHELILAFVLTASIGLSLVGILNHGWVRIAQNLANNQLYIFLILFSPMILKTKDEIEKFFHLCLIIFLPVAVYGGIQYFYGIANFEYEYLKTGYSITAIHVLQDIKPRPFSTLNSTHALSVIMFFLAGLSILFIWIRKRLFPYGIYLLFYLPGLAFAFSRTAWLLLFLGVFSCIMFLKKSRTILFYISFIIAYSVIFIFAGQIQKNLAVIQNYLPQETVWQKQAFRLGTASERLFGMENLKNNPKMYTAFGLEDELKNDPDFKTHDLIGAILVNRGVVGLLLVVVCGIAFLLWIHSKLLSIPSEAERKFATGLLALFVAFTISNLISGYGFGTFPINFFIWLCAGVIIQLATGFRLKSGHVIK